MRKSSIIGAAVVGIMAASLSAGAAGTFKCEGGNACKGQGGCKNPKMAKKHASAECKGHSFVLTKDKAACDEITKGADAAPAAPSEAPKG